MKVNSKKSVKQDIMVTLNNQKKIISGVFIVLLVVQIFIFYGVTYLGRNLTDSYTSITSIKADVSDTFINDTIRSQQRTMLNSIRQSWIQYVTLNPSIELLEKQDKEYVYKNSQGKKVVFDSNTMIKKKVNESFYDIYNKKTMKLIAKNVRPQWNNEEVSKLMRIIAAPVKAFGPTGNLIIYDAYTGEIIIDNSRRINDSTKSSEKRNLMELWNDKECKNPDQVKNLVESQLMWKRDSDITSQITSLFSEPIKMNESQINNFEIYPLGKYHREFIEKVILPYESVGVEGQEMQLGIVLGTKESELMSVYKNTINDYTVTLRNFNKSLNESMLYPIISVIVSLVVIFFAIFGLRIFAYQCKVCKTKIEEEKTHPPQ